MPRALTEQEKSKQRERLLKKGTAAVLSKGVRKVSVEEIIKEVGMAKGTFYKHFKSKGEFLYEWVLHFHQQFFLHAERLSRDEDNLRKNMREFLLRLVQPADPIDYVETTYGIDIRRFPPEMLYIIEFRDEIIEQIDSSPDKQEKLTILLERGEHVKKLLTMARIDIQKVNPYVVHNYLYAMHIAVTSDLMVIGGLPETLELMMDSLVSYIFRS